MENIIKRLLKENNLTRVALAEKIGVTESAIRHWEKRGLDKIKLKNVKIIARVLNVSVIELLGLVPECDMEILKLANRLSKASAKTKLMINEILNVDEIMK